MDKLVKIAVKIPKDWHKKIQKLALAQNQSVEAMLRQAIGVSLEAVEIDTTDYPTDVFTNRLTALEKEIGELKQTVNRLITITTWLKEQEFARSTPPSSSSSIQVPIDEDVEDEPDEILYDFLPSN